MLENYLKSAARNLLKCKTHSLINIVGLAIGLACCVLITLCILHELNYDRFFSNGDRLFRVTMSLTVNGKLDRSAGIEFPIAPRRTKEIGIRKVLGVSVANLLGLLSQDFLRLVLIANLLAWSVAYFAMTKWLADFAYRIDIGWWTFALVGGSALMTALLTVSTQAIRAALASPVEALRYE